MEWSNAVIMEFLDLYEGEPSIWDPQHDDHKDRNLTHEAWRRIQDSISVDCSITELKKKKENLMATYRKIALKMKKRKKSGIKEAYKPEWFAYERMDKFLHNIYTPRVTITSDEGPENEQNDPSNNEHSIPDPVESSDLSTACYDEDSHDVAATELAGPPTSRKRKADQTGQVEKRSDESHTFFEQVPNKPKPIKDESSLFCELLCLKLRALDDDTREIAMHEINNMMFNFRIPKLKQPPWSHPQNYQQPGYFANSAPHGRGYNVVVCENSSENSD